MKTDEIELFKIDGTYRQLTEREEAFVRKHEEMHRIFSNRQEDERVNAILAKFGYKRPMSLHAFDPTQEDIDNLFFELGFHDD